MQIEIAVDETCKDIKIIIVTPQVTNEVHDIIQKLQADVSSMMIGFQGDQGVILNEEDLHRIYSANGKIYAVAGHEEYTLRLRLYELEQRLDKHIFVRISYSEIVNLKKVKSFDLGFTGTICIHLTNGTTSFVSRKKKKKIKQVLGI